jgi:histone H4
MAGRGKNSKVVGKSLAAKKNTKSLNPKPTIDTQITNGAIRRLARRGGVSRISYGTNNHVREYIDEFLNKIVRDSLSYCEYRKAMTITAMDVVYALKKNGQTIYGYGP